METIVSYLPLTASSALLTIGAADDTVDYISTQTSLLVMAAYALVLIVAAVVTLRRRDASHPPAPKTQQ